MRKKILLAGAIGLALAGSTLAGTSVGNASTPSVDLAISGSVVAGVKSAATGTELAFTFTMKNKSSSTSADVDFWITVTGSEGGPAEDYICPLISTHANISPDASFCFPGVLGPGKTTQAAVLTPKSGSPMSVQACAEDVSNYADPVSSNNCKTLTVK